MSEANQSEQKKKYFIFILFLFYYLFYYWCLETPSKVSGDPFEGVWRPLRRCLETPSYQKKCQKNTFYGVWKHLRWCLETPSMVSGDPFDGVWKHLRWCLETPSYQKKVQKELFPDLVRFTHNPLRNFVATWVIFLIE